MFGLGMPEVLMILAIALIVIGPKKLPDLAKTLGRAMGEFKRSAQDFKQSIDMESTDTDFKNINHYSEETDAGNDSFSSDEEKSTSDDAHSENGTEEISPSKVSEESASSDDGMVRDANEPAPGEPTEKSSG